MEAGELAAARASLPPHEETMLRVPPLAARSLGFRCRVFLADGDLPAAQAAFAVWRTVYDSSVFPDGGNMLARLNTLGGIDDGLLALADHDRLVEVAAAFEQWTQVRSAGGNAVGGTDYLRGAIALKLDRVDVAERWFSTGLKWAQHWGLDTITGRNSYGLAEVAERQGDHALAMQQLDTAGALFAERGAKLYLDQVIAKKREPRGVAPPTIKHSCV